jgi:hypothetical protein
MKNKIGDKVYFIGKGFSIFLKSDKEYTIYRIDEEENSIDVFGNYNWYREDLFIPAEIYNSPLYKVMNE